MKKRINTIDGKILVQGGTDNELKSNEIRVNADKTLTERVDGKIVSAGGGSGAGGGLRPITADDVTEILLLNNKADIESHNYWEDKYIIMPANYYTVVKFKSTEKNVFIGSENGNEFTVSFQNNGSVLFKNNTAFDKTLYLDLYIQD